MASDLVPSRSTPVKHQHFDYAINEATSDVDWEQVYEYNGVKVLRKTRGEGSTGFKRHKYVGVFPYPPEVAYHVISAYEERRLWNQQMIHFKNMGEICPDSSESSDNNNNNSNGENGDSKQQQPFVTTHILHTALKPPAVSMMAVRDFVVYSALKQEGTDRYMLVSYTPDEEELKRRGIAERVDRERDASWVRAEVSFNATIIERITGSPFECRFYVVSEYNPGGWVNVSFANFVMKFAVSNFYKMMVNRCNEILQLPQYKHLENNSRNNSNSNSRTKQDQIAGGAW